MSTRSIIVVTGPAKYNQGDETIRLYKHSDGYPTGNLPIITEAIEASSKILKEHNKKWAKISKPGTFSTGLLIGKIIGVATDEYGMGANIDAYEDDLAVYSESFDPKHLGNQADLEWMYVVDLNTKTLNIYTTGYRCDNQASYKAGPTDPLEFVQSLKEDFQQSEREKTIALVKGIEALGFKVNPKSKAKRTKKLKGA